MYQSYYQFDARPFPAAPQADFYVPLESWEETLQTVARVIERAEGPALVVGGVGTGKSLLCHLLASHYQNAFQVALLSSTRLCTSRALLQNLLFELGLPYRDCSEGELRFSLLEALSPTPENVHGMLLIVDEAQNLPRRLMEEIRMLTNLVRGGESRVRLVLAGNTRLEEQFAHPRMESFNQRLACRCYLETLTTKETGYYIRTQLQSVNAGQLVDIFDESAIAAIQKLTDGVPRVINQLCDHALLAAAAQQVNRVDQRAIEIAWADLQQLPPTLSDDEPVADSSSVIEFGQLEEFSEGSGSGGSQATIAYPETVEMGLLDELPVHPVTAELSPGEASDVSGSSLEEAPESQILPVEQLPVEQLPVEQLPVEQLPVEQLPVEQLPVEQLPVEEAKVDFLSLADACPQDPGLETAWIVQAPLTHERDDATGRDPGMLITRHDEQHGLNPDHQPVSAEALERQRQLLDRFRQA
jgi:type II secretory pathway predicted ATPase ExeA